MGRRQRLLGPLLLHLLLVALFGRCHGAQAERRDAGKLRPAALTPRGGGGVGLAPSLSLPSLSDKVIAGGASRAFAQAVLYPVDALRTLAQT